MYFSSLVLSKALTSFAVSPPIFAATAGSVVDTAGVPATSGLFSATAGAS